MAVVGASRPPFGGPMPKTPTFEIERLNFSNATPMLDVEQRELLDEVYDALDRAKRRADKVVKATARIELTFELDPQTGALTVTAALSSKLPQPRPTRAMARMGEDGLEVEVERYQSTLPFNAEVIRD